MTTRTNIDGLPIIKSPIVREFIDALEALHRPGLKGLALTPDAALSPEGLKLKRTYLALRSCGRREP